MAGHSYIMIELFSYSVEQPSIEFLRLNWTIKPTTEDISSYTFGILRSNSPGGPFDLVKEIKDVFHYDDFEVNQKSEFRIFYYKLRIIALDGTFHDNGPYYLVERPDPIALEMIRKKNVALYNGSTPAKNIYVFIRKTWGTYCPQCFDPIKKRRTVSDCATCYNTNYIGGFFTPILTKGFFGPSSKDIQQLGFEYHPEMIYVELANYPLVSPGDIIKHDFKNKFRVSRVRTTSRGTYIVTQIVEMEGVNQNDIEYQL